MTNQTTQSFIPIKDLRDGVIIREDGFYCAIILVSALNFSLKSDDERKAILYQFQNLLNSLDLGIQILIQSRKINIKPYLAFMNSLYEKQTLELLKIQTKEYINFIEDFISKNDIMSKQFFIIIPFSPAISSMKRSGSFLRSNTKTDEEESLLFEQNKAQLNQRVSYIQNNIRSLGLKAVQLGTSEITELLYQTFNPGDTQDVPII